MVAGGTGTYNAPMRHYHLSLRLSLLLWLGGLPALFAWSAEREPIDSIVAVVNDDVVLRSELDRGVDNVVGRLRERHTSLPPIDFLEQRVLEKMIQQKVQLQLAERTGIQADDTRINESVRRIAAQNGLTLDEFRRVLAEQGHTFDEFRTEIRDKMVIAQLERREVVSRISVGDNEIDEFLARHGEEDRNVSGEWRIAQILIEIPEGASPAQIRVARTKAEEIRARIERGERFEDLVVSESDGQNALQGGDLGWRTADSLPDFLAEQIDTMRKGDISDPIRSPSGFHIVMVADYRGEQQFRVVQTHARHILVRTNETTSAAQARTRLDQLRLRIEGGDEFGPLAHGHSDDTGSAARGGDLGWVNPGALVPRFEQVMDELAPGEVSEPFETEFGWHIVQVLERRERDQTDEVLRAKAREAILERKTEAALKSWQRRLRDEAYVEIRLDQDDLDL